MVRERQKAGQNGARRRPGASQRGRVVDASGSVPRFGLVQSHDRCRVSGGSPTLTSERLGIADRVSCCHAVIVKNGAEYHPRLGNQMEHITGRGRRPRSAYKLKDRDQVVFGSAKLSFERADCPKVQER